MAQENWTGFHSFESRKTVEAAVIVAAEFGADGGGKVVINDWRGGTETIAVPAGFKRPNTQPSMNCDGGDILLKYADGYLSWIPRDKFESGEYTRCAGLSPA